MKSTMTAWSCFMRLRLLCLFILMLTLTAPAGYAQMSVPQYSQTQGPWTENILGFSTNGSTIRIYGCGVTCLAMLHRYYGVSTDPGEMNNWLKANNGFSGIWGDSSREYIVWSNSAGRGVSCAGWIQNPSSDAINAELDSGHPVIVQTLARTRSGGTTMHYVVLTGRSGNTYFINDPIDGAGGKTTFSSRYSVFSYMYKYRGQVAPPPPVANTNPVPLYRYSNSRGRGDRFYTTNFGELGNGGSGGWVYEGVQCHVYASQVSGTIPLYRYSSPSLGLHFYTTQNVNLNSIGYHLEGIQCYVYGNSICYTDPSITPLFRYYNTWNNSHFYTTNWRELGGGGGSWHYEGIECNVRL